MLLNVLDSAWGAPDAMAGKVCREYNANGGPRNKEVLRSTHRNERNRLSALAARTLRRRMLATRGNKIWHRSSREKAGTHT